MVMPRRCLHTEVRPIVTKNRFLVVLIAGAMMALPASSAAQVVDATGTAGVDIEPALALALVASPNWGRVVAPAAGNARYKLDHSTGAVSLVSGNGYTFDDGQAGEYTVTGSPGAPISFNVAIGAFTGAGITVIESHINGVTDSGTDNLDGGGSFTLTIGGILEVASNATVGAQTATVTVTVDYP